MTSRVQSGRTLTYGLLDAIGKSIVIGAYDKVSFPTEWELARQHRVSRGVAREAIKMLAAKGLLTARPRHGTAVQPSSTWNLLDPDVLRWMLERKFSLELLEQFNQLRAGIEPEAAALAAVFASPEECEAITAGLARMKAAAKGLDDRLESDIEFHVAILKGSRNPFYRQLEDLVQTALRFSIRFTNQIPGDPGHLAAHAAVRDAIVSREPARARLAMQKLIHTALDKITHAKQSKEGPHSQALSQESGHQTPVLIRSAIARRRHKRRP